VQPVEVADERRADEQPDGAVRRGRGWLYGIAAAALIALFMVLLANRADMREEGTARLIALVPRDERLVESRLSGFPWAEYRGPQRAGAATDPRRKKLIGAAEKEQAARDRSGESQHLAGVAMLLAGRELVAARRLQLAADLAPRDARIRSDLAAARYAAALHRDQHPLYAEALEAADAALAIEPRLPEALFNRALILERLGSHDEARAAWQRYLAVDGSSQWAEEARVHANDLRVPRAQGAGGRAQEQ
jgi:tetratricopeptide (TPR) repeat protein